ncbi:hypothetical protein [Natrialbaceae archaeon AArc-T1-2]|uniref:hypothetical protein n=1 Tax=Natrialbaceae archaeon AArc-T1-2 TaxID=3053904 RepID=UPI00255A86EB|nr:hypothetical protein [Natrialbaceae archaeon AArc-T1-2]WIV66208.1 hypothetical protein QQ977_10955 [Natrialbaceae archaeon AArc-T1-2]
MKTVRTAVDHETLRSVSKLVLSTLSLILLLSVVAVLPGVGHVIPGTPMTFVAAVGAIATVAIVGLLLYLAPALAKLVRSTLEGPQPVVDDVASIVQLFVVLVAVLVAHRGLAPALTPLLGGAVWVYDLVFLALALPPLAILAARLYVSLDPMAELLAESVTDDPEKRDEASGVTE